MIMKQGEHVVTAYAQRARGPGWGNQPLWVIVRGLDGKLREECIQPAEQSDRMMWLYDCCEAAHLSMVAAVTRAVEDHAYNQACQHIEAMLKSSAK